MFIEKTKDAGEILFLKYLGEIEDFILKQPKRQILILNCKNYTYFVF